MRQKHFPGFAFIRNDKTKMLKPDHGKRTSERRRIIRMKDNFTFFGISIEIILNALYNV